MDGLESEVIEISNLFYQDDEEEGMKRFMGIVGALGGLPGVAEWINPLFDSLERKDYYYAADLLRYKML